MAEVGERPQEQAGADEQHERDRDLHGEEDLLAQLREPTTPRLGFLERGIDVHPGAAQRRQDAEEQAGQAADRQHEQ